MTHEEQRTYLIEKLLGDERRYREIEIPSDTQGQKDLLRGLMNVRPPREISDEFLTMQDEYLKEAIRERGITRLDALAPADGEMYLWQGDIATLACDAIVNAANSGMLGCFRPLHTCINNPSLF